MSENKQLGEQAKAPENKNENKEPFLEKAKHTLSLDLTRPVLARVRNRYKELKEIGSAKHEKEMRGNVALLHTKPPLIFMSGLSATIEAGIGIITYTKYKKDGENKMIKVTKARSPISDRMIEVSAEYVQDCLCVETIQKHKPIKKEEVRI